MISRSSARGSSRGAAADTAAAVRELSEMVRSGESTAVWVRLYDELRVDPHLVQVGAGVASRSAPANYSPAHLLIYK